MPPLYYEESFSWPDLTHPFNSPDTLDAISSRFSAYPFSGSLKVQAGEKKNKCQPPIPTLTIKVIRQVLNAKEYLSFEYGHWERVQLKIKKLEWCMNYRKVLKRSYKIFCRTPLKPINTLFVVSLLIRASPKDCRFALHLEKNKRCCTWFSTRFLFTYLLEEKQIFHGLSIRNYQKRSQAKKSEQEYARLIWSSDPFLVRNSLLLSDGWRIGLFFSICQPWKLRTIYILLDYVFMDESSHFWLQSLSQRNFPHLKTQSKCFVVFFFPLWWIYCLYGAFLISVKKNIFMQFHHCIQRTSSAEKASSLGIK